MLDPKLTLESDKLLLKPISKQDFPALMELTNDTSLWKYFTFDLSLKEEFAEWVRPALNGERLQFVVWDREAGTVLGSTAFGNYSKRDERIEIGWSWLGRQFHGSGVNQAMKLLMLEYCFETLQLKRVEFKTDVLNMPARNALKKLGAVEEGILRSHTLLTHNRRRDTIFYSVLESEWPGLAQH
ncbi:GNAT family protein [Algoriphagus sp.]|uniref:GNAT family N-acetyltransferase n=1 Tax=Algoriphagus sp. TaxID=1872435 RepID=UPI003296A3A7